MTLEARHLALVEQIAREFGSVIDLKTSPGVLIEILRNYGATLSPDDDGTGGGPTVSSIAVGVSTPQPSPGPKPGGTGGVSPHRIEIVDGNGGTGGVSPGPTISSIAVAGPGTVQVELADVLGAIQTLAGEFQAIKTLLVKTLERRD